MGTSTPQLTEEQLAALADELDEIRRELVDDLGDEDAAYIRGIVATGQRLEALGRALLWAGWFPPAWLAGTAALSVAKILDNMEVGHNVMHGQYDWMGDPTLNSKMFEWDTVCPAEQWRHTHNYVHHTYTNILGKDRDIGYGLLRMLDEQRWRPYYRGNPVYAVVLMLAFEWGVMLHDLEIDRLLSGRRKWSDTKGIRRQMWHKGVKQTLKDYVLFPLLSGPGAMATLTGNAVANLVRNVWAFSIIFCGHFPDGVASFSEDECEDESRGHWYYRQMLGSANIDGGKLFHILSGNLGFQIEHHIFPDIPAWRYQRIAPRVREICDRYGLNYTTGPLGKQVGSVWRKIYRLARRPPDRPRTVLTGASRVPAEAA
ncbi:fatty acid desaturase family protein [Actinophytocola algeriensis]|uniref:Fatty acid desaturase n=1 Tax=Actinophytocola algeriensis TaxID=1768010 RepID=A0A7W7Q835_9PSEU|nr:acyl-CoA desaturase [Actinophytocola algeriensis]MBB4908739.1 fatty acid desaturase [Actinophytocola algeriensis]MBE1474874.1 fatty acid desaturase [Actinophytocola algeriensis]